MIKQFGWLLCITGFLLCASCSFTEKIDNGETAYDRKQYAVAVRLLENEFNSYDNKRLKARSAYLLGLSYDVLGDFSRSREWLELADYNGYGPEATKGLALAYKKTKNYKEAIALLENLQRELPSDRDITRELFIIKEAQRWSEEGDNGYTVELIGQNSANSDYAPRIFEEDFLVFTSDRVGSTGGDTYKWTGNAYSDLFVMFKDGSDVRKFDAIINSKHNDGTACFSKNDQEIYFTRCYTRDNSNDAYCKLMYSDRYDGIWKEPEPLPFVGNGLNYGQPTLIENDSVLIFSCKAEDGLGGHDLYYTVREADGTWSAPELMPESINTPGNEMFPTNDGDTLYFSSDYLPGMGGLDIFKTYLRPDGRWSPPKNMKPPVNSSADDFGFIVDKNAPLRGSLIEKGFFSSNRNGLGVDDIYQYSRKEVIVAEPEEPVVTETPPKSINIYLAGRVVEPIYENEEDPNSKVIGKRPVTNAFITITGKDDVLNLMTDESGRFIEEITADQVYKVKAGKPDYLNDIKTADSGSLNLNSGESDYTINIELNIRRIYRNTEITLDNIYYDTDEWFIRMDAEPTLNDLSKTLKDNPQIKKVQLSSHTDCRATDDYNLELSQKRAQAAVDYLVSTGIAPARLSAKGYGESQPAVECECDNCTEEALQANRRTTFKIVE